MIPEISTTTIQNTEYLKTIGCIDKIFAKALFIYHLQQSPKF